MALPHNLLYMLEFVIDDLLITRQNLCAPEEYPTCVEFTFRSSVFLNICDREYGSCVNPKQPKCGKCCIFALESPITDKDRLLIHVYKKRTSRCKFLIGLTELPMKPIFDRVKESFDAENINWQKNWAEGLENMPKLKGPNKELLDNCSCYDPGSERREQLCPTSEQTKRLLPLFNLCKQQTGNMVLVMRLLCNGPAIVSAFALNSICSRNPVGPPCPPLPCPPCSSCPSCGKIKPPCPPERCPEDPCDPCCGGGSASATGGPMDTGKKCCKGQCPPCPLPKCVMPDPCYMPPPEPKKCLRYFACNLDKMCPCEYCQDEFDRECPTVPSKRRCKSVIEQRLEPCGPCGGVPAHPRYVQVQKQKDAEDARKDKQQLDKEKEKEKKKNKGRQSGGGIYCDDDLPMTPVCGQSCELPKPTTYGGAGGGGCADACNHCCPDYASCCDLDFVIDDLVITRKNHCAPEEYPTCVEITFRSSVYANLCDREYSGCVEPWQPQCGKCCIFALESPVTEADRLLIHVYKKRSDRCKFLIGLGEMKVKSLFDKIDKEFNTENWEWLSKRQDNLTGLPTFEGSNRDLLDRCECFNAGFQRLEQLCPSYVMAKRMLPLFNVCLEQTGNMVLLLRLLCHGPTLVSKFTIVGNKSVAVERPPEQHPCYIIPAERDGKRPSKGYRYFACNVDKLCPYDICEDEFDRDCPTVPCKCRCPRTVEHYKPCGDCADVPIFPRFRSFDKLLTKKKPQKKQTRNKNKKT